MFLYGAILGVVKSHGFCPVPLSFSVGFTVVKNTACLLLFGALSSWDRSVSGYGIQLIRVPDVVDVLSKSFRYLYSVLQLRINSITS